MQQRMKEYAMKKEDVITLLSRAPVGRLSTINDDGFPYTVAVHFFYEDGAIYFHCLQGGEKLENIARIPKVCFEVDEMMGILPQKTEDPCSADTAYESVVAFGEAQQLVDRAEKTKILEGIIAKYTPKYKGVAIPQAKVDGTAVVRIKIARMTGKYHK